MNISWTRTDGMTSFKDETPEERGILEEKLTAAVSGGSFCLLETVLRRYYSVPTARKLSEIFASTAFVAGALAESLWCPLLDGGG